jgi:hypothetical protein
MPEMWVKVENAPSDPVPVTGTVTTNPSGTQNVAVTGQPLSIYTVQNPALDGAYVYSQAEVAGVVAANNFMTLTNPVGSGKIIVFAGAFISSFIVGDTGATITSMRGYRASAVSGGTLQAASSIGKFQTSQPDPVGQIRTGSVTATLGTALFNSPPYIGAAKSSSPFVHQVPIPPQGGLFTLMEGESMVLRTEVGDVDTRWNLSLAWGEI